MIAVSHFDSSESTFVQQAQDVLRLLAVRPGFRRGSLARSTDDSDHWVLVTEWEDIGSYRRGFSAEVRMVAIPLFTAARDLPSAFEPVIDIDVDGSLTEHGSDRA